MITYNIYLSMQFLGKTIHAKQIKSKFLPMTGFVQVRFVTHRIGFKMFILNLLIQ